MRRRAERDLIGEAHRKAWVRGTCRWCLGPVAPPRRTFCSDPCVEQWKLRSNAGYRRGKVFERDRGICAVCGLDCKALVLGGKSAWEADHIVEVADGGGSCDLSNLQTLCVGCHRVKTAASRRAREVVTRVTTHPGRQDGPGDGQAG